MMLCIIAFLIARTSSVRLIAPIEALSQASEQLAIQDNHPIQLPVAGPREIAHLTERFNSMSRELTNRSIDLQHANTELQEYTHIITHDLKPPLINIKGHAGLIKNQLLKLEDLAINNNIQDQDLRNSLLETVTQEVPESVHYIDLSIAKTNVLIGGVLDNSRLLFRSIKLEKIDMKQLLDQVVVLFSHRLAKVDFKCEPLPTILTDPFLMEHIFSNLIDNALKYLSEDRKGKVEIKVETNESEVVFFISDNGIGLHDTQIDVFKLFKQANTDNSGAGIGLSLVKTMLAKLGGRIWHQTNKEGHGATFVFSLPLYRTSA